ncbi:MAG: hypothetical protein ACM3O4_05625 [Ignavibacteriales bacterium]
MDDIKDAEYEELNERNNEKENSNETETVIIEAPIKNIEDDKFNIEPYVLQLKHAIENGARFIAIDGTYGSGKSSIFEILREKLEIETNKKGRKLNNIIQINFLNINPNVNTVETDNNDSDKITLNNESIIINNYHRYFVNQVANDICRNPYAVEKLFYHTFFSYSNNNIKREGISKKIIDGLLLAMVTLIGLFLAISPFKDSEIIKDIYVRSSDIIPYLLYIAFVLMLLYGYGFYKPEKSDKSPMLDVDKCRNNFCKILFDNLNNKSNLFIIIDDLDRIKYNPDLQLKIISLLYNEYYPLNGLIKDINIKFIFMLDTSKFKNETEYKINSNKLFDYILYVSNNQNNIMKDYLLNEIENNTFLSKLFNESTNKNYLIGLIVSNYGKIRDIKHFLNRIMTKKVYLDKKEGVNINNDELIIISFLIDNYPDDINAICKDIEQIIVNSANFDYFNKAYKIIIKQAFEKHILSNNYYIYIYNFKDQKNLLSNSEQEIISLISNLKLNEVNIERINSIINNNNNINFTKICDATFSYILKNNKHILLGNKKFSEYYIEMYPLYNKELWTNAYTYQCIYESYKNFKSHGKINKELKKDLIQNISEIVKQYEVQLQTDEVYSILEGKVLIFLKNMKDSIFDFKIDNIFTNIVFNETNFNLFKEIQYIDDSEKKYPIIYKLYIDNFILFNQISEHINSLFIEKMRKDNSLIAINFETKLLNEEELNPSIRAYIIGSQTQNFNDIERQYNKINESNINIDCDLLIKIVDKYKYNKLLDKHFISLFKNSETKNKIFNFIRKNEFDLSPELLREISVMKGYKYNEHYLKLFIKNELYENYIYSTILLKEAFVLDKDTTINRSQKYIESIFEVFKNMSVPYKKYEISRGIFNVIKPNIYRINYDGNNFWKIAKISKFLKDIEDSKKLFEYLISINQFEEFCRYIYNHQGEFKDLEFNENLKVYAFRMSEFNVGKTAKSFITKGLGKIGVH